MDTVTKDIELTLPEIGRRTVVRTEPADPGPWPGVVMIHEIFGLDANLRVLAQRMASSGYVVFAPDLLGPGTWFGCLRRVFAALGKGSGPAIDVISGTQDALRRDPSCNGRLGVIGFCLGGGFALLTANQGYAVSSVNYGRQPADLDPVLTGACPIVASYGGRDATLKGAAARLEAGLAEHGIEHDVVEYPAAGHAFMDTEPVGPRALGPLLRAMRMGPEPAAAADAWRRIDAYFARHLAG